MTEKEQNPLSSIFDIKNAIESTDENINTHKQQIYELKGHTSQNEKAIELHTDELKELEDANRALKTQVSQLSEVVQLIIGHLEESRNQTGELSDNNELLKKQISDAEAILEEQEKTNKSQGKKNKILFTITIISFCITLLTALSNPIIYNFIKKLFK